MGKATTPKTVKTRYIIRELSPDGLIKQSKITSYGHDENRFPGDYASMEEVDSVIGEQGETYTDYIVLPVKRIADPETL